MAVPVSDFYVQQLWTEVNFADQIKTTLQGLGYVWIERHFNTATDLIDIYSHQVAAGVAKDKVFIGIRVYASASYQFAIYPFIASGYVSASNFAAALGNFQAGYGHPYGVVDIKGSIKAVQFIVVDHAEAKLLICRYPAANQQLIFGYVRPANKPAYWNEDQFLYAFAPAIASTTLATYTTCLFNPFVQGGSNLLWFTMPRFSFYISQIGSEPGLRFQNLQARRTIISPTYLANSCDTGGTFSSDFGLIAAEGLPWLGRFKQSATEEWVNLGTAEAALAVRTV